MILNHDREITIAVAGSRKATVWTNQKTFLAELYPKLESAARSSESFVTYLGLPKSKQDELKDVGGYIGGELRGGRRKASNVAGRDLLTLDLDNVPTGGTADVLRRLDALGCGYAVYSTRKHEEVKPRLRVLLPLFRTATADEYEPLARKMAEILGIELCDPTTFEASRLMYWPSVCADGQYVFQYADKPFLDTDGVLALYTNWRDMTQWPQVPGVQQAHVRLAAKQGDPTTKNGVVGAFCRAYNVYQAMDTFLPGVYVPAEDGRFSFTGGSTTGGAVVYDDGAFLYSHHATDPAGGRLVNAFDLVRLHRFAELDDDAKPDTPINKLPSYTAMCELAIADAPVAALLNRERYETATRDFAGPGAAQTQEDSTDWMQRLDVSRTTGQPAKTTDNVLTILEHDPLLKEKVAYDEFASRGLVLGALPWDPCSKRRPWTDVDDSGLRHYLERTYGITGKDRIFDAVALCAHRHTFNDVRDWLTGLVWDGAERLDTLFVDYLGAVDSVYLRAVTRKSLSAAVARAMVPGCKYDQMPILAGPQGIGKSTLLRLLGLRWYSDSLQTFEGKEASELIQGIWINELGELNGLSKSETNAVKQFLSRTEDIYREPFGRRTKPFPRRCVFFGTTNDSEFLKDHTGNRRFWPIDVGIQTPIKNVFQDLANEVEQIWAEAYHAWQCGEALYLTGVAEEAARMEQEIHRESNAKEGIIREFVNRKVPADWRDWRKRTLSERRLYWSGEFGQESVESVERDRVCAAEVWCECLNGDIKAMRRSDALEINGILAAIPGWKRSANGIQFGPPYGLQKGFVYSGNT